MSEYGAVVPFRFTLRNPGTAPLFVQKVEALTGRRWTLASPLEIGEFALLPRGDLSPGVFVLSGDGAPRRMVRHSGLLLPGQEVAYEVAYRVQSDEERFAVEVEAVDDGGFPDGIMFPSAKDGDLVLGDVERYRDIPAEPGRRAVLYDPGRRFGAFRALGAVTKIPSLPMPFEPWIRDLSVEAWTWCRALGGFVVRLSASTFMLVREDAQDPLPSLDFEFLVDLDTAPEGVTVSLATGEPFLVTSGNAYPFLRDLLLAGLGLAAGPPGGPRWAVRR